ncbi:unnamed protein product [Arabidopsis halleri]
MARARPLGPSVAPWPVETSTAHGVSSLLVMLGLAAIAATGEVIFTANLFDISGPWFNFYSSTILSNVFNQCPNTIISKSRILCSQDNFNLQMSDPKPLLSVIKQPQPDYNSIVFRTRADTLLRVDLLKPTRRSAVALSSTSTSLVTVTNLSSIDSLVEDLSANRDLTCAKSHSRICLKALMEPLSICFIYPFVALGNVLLLYVLNIGSLIPLSLCIWFFLD